jgi:hypothetical protein
MPVSVREVSLISSQAISSPKWPLAATATLVIAPVLAVACIYYSAIITGPPIRSDGAGYYMYLPALFIDRDLTFTAMAVRQAENVTHWGIILRQLPSGVYFDKYPVGPALLQLPFFALAHAWALMTKSEASGFSLPYQVANIASALFYFWVGAAFMFNSLRQNFDQGIAWATTLAAIFGTSLFHFATFDASFSHVYSFCLIAIYVWTLLKYDIEQTWKIALVAGAIFGLIVITRNSNIIVGVLALGIWVRHRDWRHAGLFAAAAAVAATPQLIYWWIATGNPIVYSYLEERFHWTNPRALDFLFSIAKGFFFWAPVALLSVAGLVLLPRRLRAFAIAASICLALQVYICSSWHIWSFAGGFGNRPMVDYVPILALPMAAAIAWMRERIGCVPTGATLAVACLWTVVMMHAYWVGIIPLYEVTAKDIVSMPQRYATKLFPNVKP